MEATGNVRMDPREGFTATDADMMEFQHYCQTLEGRDANSPQLTHDDVINMMFQETAPQPITHRKVK